MPTIITRAQWGARETDLTVYTTTWAKRTGFVVHYSAASPTQTVRAIQDYHLSKGWGDIGYNWLVDVTGRIYEGRRGTWSAVGAHAAGHNTENIGVCMIGTDRDVTDAAKASICWLYDEANRLAEKTLAKRYHSGLSGAATACPGDKLRNWVIAGMPMPGVTPSTEENKMLHGQVPHDQTPIIVCTPWNISQISFGCDLGSGKARLRVAEHVVNEGWYVTTVDIASTDGTRKDLPARVNCDRRCIKRVPIDANDKMDTAVGYLAWWT